MGASKEKFCLKWNDFEANISEAFRELREDKDFFDVTLACDDDQIQAHKVILSACSPFFRKVLRRNKHEHPLLYLKGVKYVDLVSVLSFMYHGEVDIGQEDLNNFLAVAQDLKVKGLTEKGGDSANKQEQQESNKKAAQLISPQVNRKAQENPGHEPPGKKNKTLNSTKIVIPNRVMKTDTIEADYDEIQEVIPGIPIKTEIEPEQIISQPIQSFNSSASSSYAMINTVQDDSMIDDFTNYDDADQMYSNSGMEEGIAYTAGDNKDSSHDAVENLMLRINDDNGQCSGWTCTQCEKITSIKSHMREHIESFHIKDFKLFCKFCSKQYRTRRSLRNHYQKKHEDEDPLYYNC